MADLSAPPLQFDTVDLEAPLTLVSAITEFAVAHHGATATVEYDGRRGARIVLTGTDGAAAEEFASATDVARSACRLAGVDVINTWEQELFEEIRAQASW